MSNVTPLKAVDAVAPNERTVELLEMALADAKKGRLRSFVMVAEMTEHESLAARNIEEGAYLSPLVMRLEEQKLKLLGVLFE